MLIFDFEVFMYDWLVIFKDIASLRAFKAAVLVS